ncbi:MAG TPA: nucleoid occlusion protein [Patescibacteria group bacterium]|nr:nucleoid occlusion protein [Patescibacteria group bacterium]
MKRWARILGIGADDKPTEPSRKPANRWEPVLPPPEVTLEAGVQIEQIPVENLVPNPFQPRKTFHDEALQELSQSIKEFGVLQPLLARRQQDRFELIAGERRLRASRLAGLDTVPVIVKEIDDKEMAELAMIENLQREDLHYLEEAEGFQLLMTQFAFTQDELARRVGKSQSTIANKLRLLKMKQEVRDVLFRENLTERHARALLKLESAAQLQVLAVIAEKDLNVRETEALVGQLMAEPPPKPLKQNMVKVIKDVRIFLNTIDSVVQQMRKSGMDIRVQQQQDEEFVTLQIQVRNNNNPAKTSVKLKRK